MGAFDVRYNRVRSLGVGPPLVNEHLTSIAHYRDKAAFCVVLADRLLKMGFSEFPLSQRLKALGDY